MVPIANAILWPRAESLDLADWRPLPLRWSGSGTANALPAATRISKETYCNRSMSATLSKVRTSQLNDLHKPGLYAPAGYGENFRVMSY